MAMDTRTALDIQPSRLTWYFRIRWWLPIVILCSLMVWSAFSGANGKVSDPGFLFLCGVSAVFITTTWIMASLHVASLRYWIDGTTLRINQGIVIRRSKSIPLDRVTDIQMVQGPFMRACGIWALQVQTAGSGQQIPEGILWGLHGPESARDTIMAIRDKAASKNDPGA